MRLGILGTGMYVFGAGIGSGTIAKSVDQLLDSDDIIDILGRSSANVDKSIPFYNIGDIQQSQELLADYITQNKPDGIIISLPDQLHYVALKTCLSFKVPCLVVKPFVENNEQAEELLKISSSVGVDAFVEFHKRFDIQNKWIKHQFQSGSIGRISSINVNYSQKIIIPTKVFSSWVSQTNIFQYLGVHYVDLIYWITGYTPVEVIAIPVFGLLKEEHNLDTPDSIICHIKWVSPNGSKDFMSTLNIGWVDNNSSPAMSDQRMWIKASKSTIELDQMNRGFKVSNKNGYHYPNPYFSDFVSNEESSEYQGYAVQSIKSFLDTIDGNRHGDMCDINQALISVRVTSAVNKALKDNAGWVKV